jgi:hypothetical protein
MPSCEGADYDNFKLEFLVHHNKKTPPMAELGQTEPSSFVAGASELASIADAGEATIDRRRQRQVFPGNLDRGRVVAVSAGDNQCDGAISSSALGRRRGQSRRGRSS